jgi:hypothetical protein
LVFFGNRYSSIFVQIFRPEGNHDEKPQRPRCAQAWPGRPAQPGFLIPAPDAPWIECHVIDISENGACLEVGDLAVPKLFGLSLTSGGEVLRVCTLIWRRGELIDARFVSAKQLRQRQPQAQAGEADMKSPRARI